MAERQGTGKHPHKKTEEPWPHTKESGKTESEQPAAAGAARAREQEKGEERAGSREEEEDLKRREYRDEHGNIHHHTRTSMERHVDNFVAARCFRAQQGSTGFPYPLET